LQLGFFVGFDYDYMEKGDVGFIFCYAVNDLEQCWALKNQHENKLSVGCVVRLNEIGL